MSDTPTPADLAGEPQETLDAQQETEETQAQQETPEGDTPEGASREAAKYRRRLRDTEAERDQIADTLATTRRELFRLQNALTDVQMERVSGSDPDDMKAQLDAFREFGYHRPGYVPTTGTGDESGTSTMSWHKAMNAAKKN